MESLLSPEVLAVAGSAILALLGAIFGGKFAKYKNLIIQGKELITTLDAALKDGKLTTEELKKIMSEFDDVVKAFKNQGN